MTTGTRIPRSIHPFNGFLVNTNTYFLTGTPNNATRLGITPAETNQWTAFLTQWSPLYLKYCDKANSRTTSVIEQLNAIIDRMVLFDHTNHILDRIASSTSATIIDLETFNIKSGQLQKSTRTISTTPIAEQVSAVLQPIGGGTVNIKCYIPTGARSGICDGADCVQYLYTVGNTPPASAEDNGLKKEISTKGAFNLVLGASSSAQNLYIYFRWYNTRRPELAGTWSSMRSTLIL